MPHGARVLVLGHSHTVKCKSSSLLVYTGAWIKQIKSIVIVTKEGIRQIKYIVMVTKEGPTKIINFMTQGAGVLMLRRRHISYNSEYALSSTLSPGGGAVGSSVCPASGRLMFESQPRHTLVVKNR